VGLIIASVAVKEGVAAWRGDACCASPAAAATASAAGCADRCCAPATTAAGTPDAAAR
jgi:hypothetical protein